MNGAKDRRAVIGTKDQIWGTVKNQNFDFYSAILLKLQTLNINFVRFAAASDSGIETS